jgi:hypothetical protein
VQVPEAVIERMAARMEPPEPAAFPWERAATLHPAGAEGGGGGGGGEGGGAEGGGGGGGAEGGGGGGGAEGGGAEGGGAEGGGAEGGGGGGGAEGGDPRVWEEVRRLWGAAPPTAPTEQENEEQVRS